MNVSKPLIVINFKAYDESLGERGKRLAKICESVSRKSRAQVWFAPQPTELKEFSARFPGMAVAQHVDPVDAGAKTGSVTAKSVKASGAIGAFISHAEKKQGMEQIQQCIQYCKQHGLLSFAFAGSEAELEKVLSFHPDFAVFEPPELIGTTTSVSKSQPQAIERAVQLGKRVSPDSAMLCGAGVQDGEDLRIALSLGMKGVLLSSAFVKSKNPKEVLENIARGAGKTKD